MRSGSRWVERFCIGLILALVLLPTAAAAREQGGEPAAPLRFERHAPPASDRFLQPPFARRAIAAASTTFLGGWTFDAGEVCDMQGWTTADATDPDLYFHVADATELDGGDYGNLVPLRGSQSLWCGLDWNATGFPQCNWIEGPGYGNSWNQTWETKACVNLTSDGEISYVLTVDSEWGYDATYLEASKCGENNWVLLDGGPYVFDNKIADWTRVTPIPWALFDSASVDIRFRFRSDGGFSDQDGLYVGDGALLLDDLMVTDNSGVLVPLEDFEGESLWDQETEDWQAAPPDAPFGDYAALFPGEGVLQEDPCKTNLSCFWGFFENSAYDYSCGGHPGQLALPYGDATIGYIDNEVWSPWIAWNGTGDIAWLEFDVYRDLPLNGGVGYRWALRSFVNDCPGYWVEGPTLYAGDLKDWYRHRAEFGNLVHPNATQVQFAIGVLELPLSPSFPPPRCHSQAPLIDNVAVYRESVAGGPRWTVRDMDLFQDTFPRDGSLTGTGRADMAQESSGILMNPGYTPGDSAQVYKVEDIQNGVPVMGGTPYFHRAVYCYVSVLPPDTAKAGVHLENTNLFMGLPRYPYVGMANAAGKEWTVLNCDRRRVVSGAVASPLRYCIDLPDNLFEAGDTIEYFFGAHNGVGQWSYWSREFGTVYTMDDAAAYPLEFQILPGAGPARGGDWLYVDGMDGLGAQPYFDIAFEQLSVDGLVDRFDVNAPSSALSNRLGTHVYDPDQLSAPYRTIIWNTGDLHGIGDGISPDKCDDWLVLEGYLDGMATAELTGGLYMSGDDLPSDWVNQTGASAIAMRDWLHYSVPPGGGDHAPLLGRSPFGVGVTTAGTAFGDPLDHPLGVDTLVAFGGCPLINDFDYMTAELATVVQMTYEGHGASAAAIVGEKTAAGAGTIGVMLSGFSFHYIRDDRVTPQLDRSHHLLNIMTWLGDSPHTQPVGIGSGPAYKNSLAQNYPNPFNPTTTIAFTVKERGHVRLNVYNVAGALVRRLVDDTRAPGVTHTVVWDGRNGAGQSVASGVYFYRLEAKDFTRTRKMVVLK